MKSDFKTKSSIELNSTMALAEDKINKLTKEVRRFKDEQLHLTEINESLKNQVIFNFFLFIDYMLWLKQY